MSKSSIARTSAFALCLLSAPVGAQVLGGGVGQVIGSGAGGGAPTMLPLVGDATNASVDLNCVSGIGFANGLNAPIATLVTTSRATTGAVGSYIDDTNGNWRLVPDNVLRQSNKGCLVEEARTQLVLVTSVTPAAPAGLGIITGNLPSPAGDTSAFSLTDTTVSSSYALYMNNPPTLAAATTYAYSFFVKTNSRFVTVGVVTAGFANGAYSVFDLQLGIVTLGSTFSGGGWTSVGSSIQQYANGWWRLTALVSNTGSVQGYPLAGMVPNGTVSTPLAGYAGGTPPGVLNVWTPQVEAGTFPTSPMPNTTGASVTRAADGVRINVSFGTSYTLFGSAVFSSPLSNPSNQWLLQSDIGADTNRVAIFRTNGSGAPNITFVGGTGGVILPSGAMITGATSLIAAAVAAGNQAAVFNGGTANTNTIATLPTTPTGMQIGANATAGGYTDGYIQRIAAWANTRISNSGLQTITSGP